MSVAQIFNANYYLNNNADVAVAVCQGSFANALEHFNIFGAKELRDPNAIFDATYYAEHNEDVLNAVLAGRLPDVFNHYQVFGEAESRAPNCTYEGFNAETYLAAYSDVADAVRAGSYVRS